MRVLLLEIKVIGRTNFEESLAIDFSLAVFCAVNLNIHYFLFRAGTLRIGILSNDGRLNLLRSIIAY